MAIKQLLQTGSSPRPCQAPTHPHVTSFLNEKKVNMSCGGNNNNRHTRQGRGDNARHSLLYVSCPLRSLQCSSDTQPKHAPVRVGQPSPFDILGLYVFCNVPRTRVSAQQLLATGMKLVRGTRPSSPPFPCSPHSGTVCLNWTGAEHPHNTDKREQTALTRLWVRPRQA